MDGNPPEGRMKAVKWYRKCQRCGCAGKSTGGRQATREERKVYYRCKNAKCNNTWVVLIQEPKARMAP